MTAKWQGGHTYTPGSLVIPATSSAVQQIQPENPGFETGDLTGWTMAAGAWTVGGSAYAGNKAANVAGGGISVLVNNMRGSVRVGQSITVEAMMRLTNSGTNDMSASIAIYWYRANGSFISESLSGPITGKGGSFHKNYKTAVAPPESDTFSIALGANTGSHGGNITFDSVACTYAFAAPNPGIIYKAVQPAPGKSASTEPSWPGIVGVQVTDGEVIWEGELATRVVWTAHPLALSGTTEPDWPNAPGGAVRDGTIDWIAQSAQITDPNCPNSKIVQIVASKVYAGDNDIVRYSGTVNPLDWSSTDNAGYIAFGLQTYGSNPVAAMGIYRANLVPFNSEGFQMWQVDPDPANITILDALPVASSYNKALTPIANDLLFLASQGIRSIGIAASSTNLQASDVGMPIDPLVKTAMAEAATSGQEPVGLYLPALGQAWFCFNAADRSNSQVFVYSINQIGQVGKWSRYVFPFPIDDYTMLNDELYLRSGDDVLLYDETALQDFAGDPRAVDFDGVVEWPYLDFKSPGINKELIGFDLIASGAPSVSVGYDQTNPAAFTSPFPVAPDTVPGMIIPLPITAPSMSLRVTFAGGQAWQLLAANLYLQDLRTTS